MKWLSVVGLLLLLCAVPASAQSLLGELQALRASYPTPMSKAQLGELLTRTVASAPNDFVLLRKLAGNNCPALGTLVSCDYVIHAQSGQGFDVLQDQEGQAIPTWNQGDRFTPADYVWVVGPPVAPAPTPYPTPTPGPPASTDLGPILDLMAGLERQIATLRVENHQDHEATRGQIAALAQQVEGIVLPPSVPVEPVPIPGTNVPDSGSALGSAAMFSIKYILPAVVTAIATWQATKVSPEP